MNILFAGDYYPDYNRNLIIKNGLSVIDGIYVREFVFKNKEVTSREIASQCQWADVVYVPPFAHKSLIKLKKHSGKPLVFDPLISDYMTTVLDFRKYSKYSIRAVKRFLKEKRAFRSAGILIADTNAHAEYFHQTFNIQPSKIKTVYVGADTNLFFPVNKASTNNKFVVGFYGSFIPLQGVDKIIEAAYLLRHENEIVFRLVGKGRLFDQMVKRASDYDLKNIEFVGWVDYELLNDTISQFDICLGVFGNSVKASLVVPNKVFHYAACRKPVITKQSPGIAEVFTNKSNIILCDGSAQSIVDNIQALKQNNELKEKVANNAYTLVSGKYNQHHVAVTLLEGINKLLLNN